MQDETGLPGSKQKLLYEVNLFDYGFYETWDGVVQWSAAPSLHCPACGSKLVNGKTRCRFISIAEWHYVPGIWGTRRLLLILK